LGDFRVLYQYATPTTPWRIITQDAKTETERRALPAALSWGGPAAGLTTPEPWDAAVGDGATIGGLIYRRADLAPDQAIPALVALGDGPPVRQTATLDLLPQTAAAAGFAVVVPNLRGVAGSGRAFTAHLAELADQEIEAADLADIATALGEREGIAGDRIAITGRGHGGALALLAAGARPGHYAAVVAVDPVTDWDWEVDAAEGAWRAWLLRQFGLPAVHGGRYALRAPLTFAGLLDVPLLLVGTAGVAPARADQLDAFAATLDDLGLGYERASAADEAALARLTVEFLRRRLDEG
jgi:dipeptidyl aminopeptidase/acylaminoacyl peptidase